MHEPWDENYGRGYQWWLMTEAKKVRMVHYQQRKIIMYGVKEFNDLTLFIGQ